MKAILFLFVLVCRPQIGLGQCNPAGSGSATCHSLSAQEIEAAIRAGLGQPGGEPSLDLKIEILDQSRALFPDGQLTFPLLPALAAAPDGVSVLHGYLDTRGTMRHPVWARVRMSVRKMTPVARQDLAVGTVLNGDLWEVRETWAPFPEGPIERSTSDGKALVGARLKRAARQGDVFLSSWLEIPLDIRRGQLVDLHVQTGATHLRLQATALTNARRGENVEVRLNNDHGPGLLAVTSGPGRAWVDNKAHAELADRPTGPTEGKR